MTPEDRDYAVRAMLAEAGNQGPAGMIAVANVIRNRAATGRYGGKTLRDVVLAKGQFEPFMPHVKGTANDPSRFSPNSPKYREAADLFDALNAGAIPDVTKGATHFYAPAAQSALGRNKPAWAKGEGQRLGDHVYYSPEGRVDPSAYDAMSRTTTPGATPAPQPAAFAPPAPVKPAQPPGMGDSFKGWMGDSVAAKRNDPLLFRLFRGMTASPSPTGLPAAGASGGASPVPQPVAPAAGDLPAIGAMPAGTAPMPASPPMPPPRPAGIGGAPAPQPIGSNAEGGVSPGEYFGAPLGAGGGGMGEGGLPKLLSSIFAQKPDAAGAPAAVGAPMQLPGAMGAQGGGMNPLSMLMNLFKSI